MSTDGRREEYWALTALTAVVFITAAWWALALWPTGHTTPEWLLRTQRVCFGVRANGLPDAAGWTGLIGSPLGMFGLLLVSARNAFGRVLARLRASYALRVYAAGLFLFAIAGAASATVRIREARGSDVVSSTTAANSPLVGKPAPRLRLVDQHADTIDIAALRGREVLVTFAYAHCETVCPALVHNALQIAAARNAAGRPTKLLIVTLDPRRDTPARLPTIARDWQVGREVHVLSGDVELVSQTLDDWHIARAYNAQNGVIAHSAALFEVDGRGVIRAFRS